MAWHKFFTLQGRKYSITNWFRTNDSNIFLNIVLWESNAVKNIPYFLINFCFWQHFFHLALHVHELWGADLWLLHAGNSRLLRRRAPPWDGAWIYLILLVAKSISHKIALKSTSALSRAAAVRPQTPDATKTERLHLLVGVSWECR